jgi:hypothetical protein
MPAVDVERVNTEKRPVRRTVSGFGKVIEDLLGAGEKLESGR